MCDLVSNGNADHAGLFAARDPLLKDYEEPVVMTGDGEHTVEDFCNALHKSILKEFKHAVVWGSSVKYSPMNVGKDHVLADEDVVQIIKKI